MILIALLVGAVLWFSLDRESRRDRNKWASFAATFLGLLLLAKGRPLIGITLIGGAALWSRRPRRWRRAPVEPFDDTMARADARALLGVAADADRSAIIAAHRRLITRNHPDSGGTAGLAAQLNAARDLLLKYQPP